MENRIEQYDSPIALVEANYPGQYPRQASIYLLADLRGGGEISVEVRPETGGGGTPGLVWGGHIQRWRLPCDTDARYLREYVDTELMPLLKQIRAGYSTDGYGPAKFTADAQQGIEEIEYRLEISETDGPPTFDDGGLWDIGEWLQDQVVPANTTDAELEVLAASLENDAAIDLIVLDGDILDFFRERREEAREAANG